MLPINSLDPIHINLCPRRQKQQQRRQQKNYGDSNTDDVNTTMLTLYPVTVEFDRLLRRKHQLNGLENSSSSSSIHFVDHHNHHSNHNHSNHNRQNIRSPPSASANVLDDCQNVQNLLYSTVMHFHATTSNNNNNKKIDSHPHPYYCHHGHHFSAASTGSTTKSKKNFHHKQYGGYDYNGDDVDDNNDDAERDDVHNNPLVRTTMITPEIDSLAKIYQTLCKPGTRTLLFLADKNEIFKHLQSSNNVKNGIQEEQQQPKEQEEEEKAMKTEKGDQSKKKVTENGNFDGKTSKQHQDEVPTTELSGEINDCPLYYCSSSYTCANNNNNTTNNNITINTSTSDDCISRDVFEDDTEDCFLMKHCFDDNTNTKDDNGDYDEDETTSTNLIRQGKKCLHQNQRKIPTTRTDKIQKIFSNDNINNINSRNVGNLKVLRKSNSYNGKLKLSSTLSSSKTSPLLPSSSLSSSNKSNLRIFLKKFDQFIDQAFVRKQKLKKIFNNNNLPRQDDDSNGKDPLDLIELIGLEQQIIGALVYYKSYRLESLKIIEISSIAVQKRFQRLGIGTRLIKCLKENSQIGQYDSMNVRIDSENYNHLKFFLKNDFTDDLILNASYDQLMIPTINDDYEQKINHQNSDDMIYDDYNDDDNPEEDQEEEDQQDYDNDGLVLTENHHHSHHHNNVILLKKSSSRSNKSKTISLCYLPPFSVGTLSESMNNRLIEQLDNRFVDDIIEQANLLWRRDLLSSYRTQWSCVARLKSEIMKLRQQLSKRDLIIDQLRRENLQLRNSLIVHNKNRTNSANNNTTTNNLGNNQINFQKQLSYLYRNFQFDSLDF